ncbi:MULTISPECIES: metallophosphoesterase [unclassified Fibrobacter]|uniref:metallophosphoesterase n=1 Tax=unclassified Fibrobacter TaxID=2634177 RepID=UPI0025BD4307|nr:MULTISPECIES: metallophosphoesterase [unclassified Fibrobacter]
MVFFLLLLLSGLVLICINVSPVLPGRRGKLLALGVLVSIFAGMSARGTFVGSLAVAFLSVWLCQALLLYIPWGVFRGVRRVVTRRALDGHAVMLASRGLLVATVAMTLGLCAYGVPHNAKYVLHETTVNLPAGGFTAVFFSDIHVDPLFDRAKLERMIADVDSIAPDYLLFGGDLADVPSATLDEWGYDTLFKKLTAGAKVAAVAVNGNHEGMQEFPGSNPNDWMRKVGFVVLDDSSACIGQACFTGRIDFQVARGRGVERRPLAELVPVEVPADSGSVQTVRPWILLDHQPKGIESGYSGRLPDFALSGHTHNGQFFPGNFVINLVWRLAYGEGVLDGVRWLVSAGVDCWGPPVRVGTDADMWIIRFEAEGNNL